MSKRVEPTQVEKEQVLAWVEEQLELKTFHLGKAPRGVIRFDKRPQMYGGDGTVYLLQMFEEEGELVNNRIGAYMVLPTKKDSVGFHTHGNRKEQEVYVIMSGEAIYKEKDNNKSSEVRQMELNKGNITTVAGEAFHSVENRGAEPLIIFVLTTYEK